MRFKREKPEKRESYQFTSQLDLPFLESAKEDLPAIFQVLEKQFNLKKQSKQKLIDLGCGEGRIVIFSALNYEIRSLGIEINENLIEEAHENLKILRKNQQIPKRKMKKVRIKLGDIFRQNLGGFDFIYIFTLPTMNKFLNHVFLTADKGAIIISYKYPLKGFDTYLKDEYHLEGEREVFYYKKVV